MTEAAVNILMVVRYGVEQELCHPVRRSQFFSEPVPLGCGVPKLLFLAPLAETGRLVGAGAGLFITFLKPVRLW